MTEYLYLNKIRVDLKSGSVTRKLQVGDVGDISARKSTYSYSIKLLKTTKTLQMLDMLGVSGNTSRKPYELIVADYIVDTVPLVSNGFAKISTNSDYIVINVYDGIIDLSEKLTGKKISELPFSDLDHFLSTQLYIDSYENTSGYIYCIADYGQGFTQNVKVEKQAPSLYIHTIMGKIFESVGLNLIGDFFTTNQKYLSEVLAPSVGYDVEDEDLVETYKGSADSDDARLSYYNTETFEFEEERLIDLSSVGIVGVTVVDGTLVFNVAGSYKIDIHQIIQFSDRWLSLKFKINGLVKAIIEIESGEWEGDSSVVFLAEVGDIISLHLFAKSRVITEGGELGKYKIDYLNYWVEPLDVILQEGGQLISVTDYIGDIGQLDFVKDVISRYGLILHPIKNSSDYDFELIDNILGDRENAEDWTNKLSLLKGEKYVSGYAKKNKMTYSYPEEIVIPNNDGEMLIDNDNAEEEKPMYGSFFQVPNISGILSGESVFSIPVWGFNDLVLENKETPVKLMYVKRIDVDIFASLFDEVTTIDASENIPFLDVTSMQYFIDNHFDLFQKLINSYKGVEGLFELSVIDIYNINFFRLKYLKQTGRFYYLDSLTNTQGKLTKANLKEILEF